MDAFAERRLIFRGDTLTEAGCLQPAKSGKEDLGIGTRLEEHFSSQCS